MLDFIILGAQKAATSTLQASLSRVDGICLPRGESAFFEDPDYKYKPWRSINVMDHTCRRIGIKRPDYLCSTKYMERISRSLPYAKFIVVLREPVERAVSGYLHLARHGKIEYSELNKGMERSLHDYNQGLYTTRSSVVRFGLYGAYISKWLEIYPQSQFLFLSYSEIVLDIKHVLTKCCRHLELENFSLPDVVSNVKNRGVNGRLSVSISRCGHTLKTERMAETGRREGSKSSIKRSLGNVLVLAASLMNIIESEMVLESDTRNRLNEVYRKDLEVLRGLVDNSVLYWDYE